MKYEINAEIRSWGFKVIAVGFLFLILSYLLGSCGVQKIQLFQSKGQFTSIQLDSVCKANNIPEDLSLWKQSTFVLQNNKPLVRYVWVEQVDSKKTDESIYTIEQRDSIFIFYHRVTK